MERSKEGLQQVIRYLRDVKKLTFRQVAEELNISRGKCLRLYSANLQSRPEGTRVLDAHRGLIAAWYQEHPSLKAIQVLARLRERGVSVGYTAVKECTRELRRRRRRCYHELSFEPGEEAQVDWFFLNHPQLGKLAGFAFLLSYSRYFFARFFPRYSLEFFIEGHLLAFAKLGGVPRALRYDNLKSVVLSRTPLRYNPGFVEFARFYGFDIRLCTVGRANEKGRVERAIRSLRSTFCNVATRQRSLEALNADLHQWCMEKNRTIHRSTGRVPEELLPREPLKPLPAGSWRNALVLPPQQSSKTGLLTYDTNRYSIPDYLVGERLSIHAFCDKLEIFDGKGRKVASHPRSFARQQMFINPAHRSFSKISPQAKRERIYAVVKNIDPAVAQFLVENEHVGEDPYLSAHGLFLLLRAHHRQTLLSAVREALVRRLPRLNFVRSLLTAAPQSDNAEVMPQQQHLLEIDYQPRSLEEYE